MLGIKTLFYCHQSLFCQLKFYKDRIVQLSYTHIMFKNLRNLVSLKASSERQKRTKEPTRIFSWISLRKKFLKAKQKQLGNLRKATYKDYFFKIKGNF